MAHKLIPVKLNPQLYAETYVDSAYGSYIAFNKGESLLLEPSLALKLLGHPDVYVKGDAAKATPVAAKPAERLEEDPAQQVRDELARMSREDLFKYAEDNYRQKFPRTTATEALKEAIFRLVDIQGVPG